MSKPNDMTEFVLSEIRRARKMLDKGRGLEECKHPAESVKWNPLLGVTQCHACGQVMPDSPPPDSAQG